MITLYGFPNSRSLRVSWLLEELGADYDYQLIDLRSGAGQSPEYLAINPGGKVPALRDGDLVLTESAAIVTYLGDKSANRQLVPEPGTPLRGKYDQWCHFAMCELEQPLWNIAKHKFAIPEQYRVANIVPTADWEFQKALNVLSQGLGDKPYILGDSFSAADILLAHTLFWGKAFEQKIEQPNLLDYIGSIQDRPALQRAREREQNALE